VLSQDVKRFIRNHIRTVWDLELLLLLQRDPSRAWRAGELVRELRASTLIIGESLIVLTRTNCIVEDQEGLYRYNAATPAGTLVPAVKEAYIRFPAAVSKLIWEAPHSKIQTFADAFRLKKD
jgi:hypothetical protein